MVRNYYEIKRKEIVNRKARNEQLYSYVSFDNIYVVYSPII